MLLNRTHQRRRQNRLAKRREIETLCSCSPRPKEPTKQSRGTQPLSSDVIAGIVVTRSVLVIVVVVVAVSIVIYLRQSNSYIDR